MVNYGDYYYKYKALKYYLKNNSIEKQKQMKGGSTRMDVLANVVNNEIKEQNKISELKNAITQLQNEINNKDNYITQLQNEINNKDNYITQLKNAITQLQNEINNKDNYISQLQLENYNIQNQQTYINNQNVMEASTAEEFIIISYNKIINVFFF